MRGALRFTAALSCMERLFMSMESSVKEIMIAEQIPNYTIRAKTGWFGFGNPGVQNIGWYVGYAERGDDVYFFATNIDINSPQDGSARLEVTRRCLQELGILP
ncbi:MULTISPECIES: penicillin-binding transpeptidase domain-containing protein [unclassified Picosynechococcus]|uniref:penicillin-binding transpeptidase domain-containing protein n=2 Tax=Cyanobacteriota TaxID=1117 RepID=UPI00067402C0|nr:MULTISPECIES: penicillin-binding transpeptidase domain-containing protein [unclassified Picosynechococcus]ANV91270.1 hypothetical protein AWQ24_11875 [Picosynechococcus sp. PCC 8807]SMH52417.1 beta-lactamase class D [Picosynechococcus sp. OG1]